MTILASRSTDMSTRALAIFLGTVLALMLSFGCTQQTHSPPPKTTAEPLPVIDSSPYWCDVIPQQAIRVISGLTIPLEQSKEGVPATHGGCALRNEYNHFSLNWSIRDGEKALDLAR